MVENVKVGDFEVVLDERDMEFNETNLNEYIKKEHGRFAYLSTQLANVEHAMWVAEEEYHRAYSEKFVFIKEGEGGSDKLVESKCLADQEVFEKKKKFLDLKRDVAKIKAHLRAWDKAHENAQSLGHNLRKEMDKLGSDIYFKAEPQSDPKLEKRLEEIMNKVEVDDNR